MKVPALQPYSSVPTGGVWTKDLHLYFIKSDATTACNLADGSIITGINGADPVAYLPAAQLVLG